MNFDRLAPHYDWLEAMTAGRALQQVRIHWLDALAGRQRILSVGEGHGRFAAACLARFPEAELTCVEASPAMLSLARHRTRGMPGRVSWIGQEVLNWQFSQRYDAIVTCFFLDCFTPDVLNSTVTHLAGAATDDAIWLLSDFAVPSSGLARWRAKAIHALMYGFFQACAGLPARRLTAPDAMMSGLGFQLTGRKEFEWGLLRSEIWHRQGPSVSRAGLALPL